MKKRERSQGTAASGLLIMLVANRTRGWYTVHENVDHVSAVCEWSVSGMKKRIHRPL